MSVRTREPVTFNSTSTRHSCHRHHHHRHHHQQNPRRDTLTCAHKEHSIVHIHRVLRQADRTDCVSCVQMCSFKFNLFAVLNANAHARKHMHLVIGRACVCSYSLCCRSRPSHHTHGINQLRESANPCTQPRESYGTHRSCACCCWQHHIRQTARRGTKRTCFI